MERLCRVCNTLREFKKIEVIKQMPTTTGVGFVYNPLTFMIEDYGIHDHLLCCSDCGVIVVDLSNIVRTHQG